MHTQTRDVDKNISQQSSAAEHEVKKMQYAPALTCETYMCQQGWSMLHLSSLPLWQNQRTLLAHCPPQSLHRRQPLSPSKRRVPEAR